MSEVKYYCVYSTGKLQEVDRRTYLNAFNDPYVTLAVEESGDFTIEKLTEETENEPFRNLQALVPSKS